MAFNKITEEDLAGRGVLGLPDIPGLSTTEMQRKFEETSREVIIPKFNELVEKLNSPEFAEEIKPINPVTEEESTLQESLNDLHEETSEARSVAEVFKDIESVSSVINNTETEIPNSKAIVDYVKVLGAADMQTSVYDKNKDGVVDDSEALGGIPAEEYALVKDVESLGVVVAKAEQDLGGFAFLNNPNVVYNVSTQKPYEDENGAYILSDSETGASLLADADTYYSAALGENAYSVGGADSVLPFSGGGVTAEDLYNALQYSGLVTPDMTAEEMLAELETYFVGSEQIISGGNLVGGYATTFSNAGTSGNPDPGYYTISSTKQSNTSYRTYIIAYDSSKFNAVGSLYIVFNKKHFKKLALNVSVNTNSSDSNYKGTNTTQFRIDGVSKKTLSEGANIFEIDLSGYENNKEIKLELYTVSANTGIGAGVTVSWTSLVATS